MKIDETEMNRSKLRKWMSRKTGWEEEDLDLTKEKKWRDWHLNVDSKRVLKSRRYQRYAAM